MLRTECEEECNDENDADRYNDLISRLEIVRKQFEDIKFQLGIDRVDAYILSLKNRHSKPDGKPSTFKSLLRFKTLKKSHIATLAAKDSNLGESILNNEDLKLFTT